jgi:hypothetical protein
MEDNSVNILNEANYFTIGIKGVLNSPNHAASNDPGIDPGIRVRLERAIDRINEYISEISQREFSRNHINYKENVLRTLEDTKTRINGLLSSGGRRRKSIRHKTSRKSRKSIRKTYRRSRRSRKAYRK